MTTILLLYGISGWLLLVMIRFIPMIIGNFATANKSLARQDSVSLGRFDNCIYVFVVKFIGVIVITATITMILAYLRHICMMLKITCYRIKHSMDEYVSHMTIHQQNRLICQKLINAVKIQRRAIH
ncbi:uncharacterized protein LOC105182718 isoform X2 [Harpegnathos saltator]|uniref:uncharacterized protein LOC105182718 isoform X2 n=1 Tax=Harpegnathos saltator TaxID=610380 RepID=UPI000DBEDB96|nr:uncharacterized protein LOC105182718 isoform X2 [Harpegnathos saltator]